MRARRNEKPKKGLLERKRVFKKRCFRKKIVFVFAFILFFNNRHTLINVFYCSIYNPPIFPCNSGAH